MPNTIQAAAEGMPTFTRRKALGFLAAIATPTAAVASAAPLLRKEPAAPSLTPQEQLEAAIAAMEAAMIAVHGEGVRVYRDDNDMVSFLKPKKPRIVEWQGDGVYEIKLADGKQPMFRIVRSSAHDHFTDGRCFKLEPVYAKSLGVRYMYERDLQRVLIRKIR